MDNERDILRDMANESAAFSAFVARVHDEATKTINAAAQRLEANHAVLQRRLLIARLSSSTLASSPPEPIEEDGTGGGGRRRSARDIILTLLADATGPVASGELDRAVIAAGWTQAAAAKVKSRLRREKVATADKRLWVLTEAGARAKRNAE